MVFMLESLDVTLTAAYKELAINGCQMHVAWPIYSQKNPRTKQKLQVKRLQESEEKINKKGKITIKKQKKKKKYRNIKNNEVKRSLCVKWLNPFGFFSCQLGGLLNPRLLVHGPLRLRLAAGCD